jgi:hypothetical protein
VLCCVVLCCFVLCCVTMCGVDSVMLYCVLCCVVWSGLVFSLRYVFILFHCLFFPFLPCRLSSCRFYLVVFILFHLAMSPPYLSIFLPCCLIVSRLVVICLVLSGLVLSGLVLCGGCLEAVSSFFNLDLLSMSCLIISIGSIIDW